MAELVDALDSGSSGQYACGGSSPPFRSLSFLACKTTRSFKTWVVMLLLLLMTTHGCAPRGEAEVAEIRAHLSNMTQILERHQNEPRRAMQELERYESDNRTGLEDLNKRVKDLRPQLTSSEKRELSEQWKAEISELESKLNALNERGSSK